MSVDDRDKTGKTRSRCSAVAKAAAAQIEELSISETCELRRNIDMLVKGVIEEDDARQRIADLKAWRLEVEAEIASLEEVPKIITLHPATLDCYAETMDALVASLADHAKAEDDRGP